jgi:hypothetical protein
VYTKHEYTIYSIKQTSQRAAPPSVDGFKQSISPEVAAAAAKLEQQCVGLIRLHNNILLAIIPASPYD